MWDISLADTPNLVAFLHDFSVYFFFLLHVLIFFKLFRLTVDFLSFRQKQNASN